MPVFVYIVQSQSSGRYYCGQTEDLERRLQQHNDPNYYWTKTTKVFPGPWNLVWKQEFPTRKEALIKERSIKNIGIHRFLERQRKKNTDSC